MADHRSKGSYSGGTQNRQANISPSDDGRREWSSGWPSESVGQPFPSGTNPRDDRNDNDRSQPLSIPVSMFSTNIEETLERWERQADSLLVHDGEDEPGSLETNPFDQPGLIPSTPLERPLQGQEFADSIWEEISPFTSVPSLEFSGNSGSSLASFSPNSGHQVSGRSPNVSQFATETETLSYNQPLDYYTTVGYPHQGHRGPQYYPPSQLQRFQVHSTTGYPQLASTSNNPGAVGSYLTPVTTYSGYLESVQQPGQHSSPASSFPSYFPPPPFAAASFSNVASQPTTSMATSVVYPGYRQLSADSGLGQYSGSDLIGANFLPFSNQLAVYQRPPPIAAAPPSATTIFQPSGHLPPNLPRLTYELPLDTPSIGDYTGAPHPLLATLASGNNSFGGPLGANRVPSGNYFDSHPTPAPPTFGGNPSAPLNPVAPVENLSEPKKRRYTARKEGRRRQDQTQPESIAGGTDKRKDQEHEGDDGDDVGGSFEGPAHKRFKTG